MSTLAEIARQIRAVLEEGLDPELASAVFFEALTGRQAPPETREEVVQLVQGPLYAALVRRIADTEASDLVTRILRRIDPGSSGLRFPKDEEPTRTVPTCSLPVEVTVLSAGPGFATKLNAALGPERVAARVAAAATTLGSGEPSVVVVDATDFAPVAAVDVAEALRALPPTIVRVLWGADLPFGQGVAKATRPDDPVVLMLPLGGGIDPLLDVIRSRRVEL